MSNENILKQIAKGRSILKGPTAHVTTLVNGYLRELTAPKTHRRITWLDVVKGQVLWEMGNTSPEVIIVTKVSPNGFTTVNTGGVSDFCFKADYKKRNLSIDLEPS